MARSKCGKGILHPPASPEIVTYANTDDVLADTGNDDDTYASADLQRGSTDSEQQARADGLIHIYARSNYGGRPQSTVDETVEDSYYSYVDLKRKSMENANAAGEEKWTDNSKPPATDGNDSLGETYGSGQEDWKTNSIYGKADNGDSQEEGWEENSIYVIDNWTFEIRTWTYLIMRVLSTLTRQQTHISEKKCLGIEHFYYANFICGRFLSYKFLDNE